MKVNLTYILGTIATRTLRDKNGKFMQFDTFRNYSRNASTMAMYFPYEKIYIVALAKNLFFYSLLFIG